MAEGLAVIKCSSKVHFMASTLIFGLIYMEGFDSTVEEHILLVAESLKTLLFS